MPLPSTTCSWNDADYYVRRPSLGPSTPVALGVRSVVRRHFAPEEKEDDAVRAWVKLLWCVQGIGIVQVNGKECPLPPDHVALFLPGMRHKAWASPGNQEWEVRWCTLDGPLCEPFVRSLGLDRAGVWHVGPPPIEAFEQLRAAIADSVTPAGQRHADVAAHRLLTLAANDAAQTVPHDPIVTEAVHLLQERWLIPDFGIEQLASALGIHRSVLSRRFRSQIGVAPSQYLTNLRLQQAISLLRSSKIPIREVALRCGYGDSDYFIRAFRRTQGRTPGVYRSDQEV